MPANADEDHDSTGGAKAKIPLGRLSWTGVAVPFSRVEGFALKNSPPKTAEIRALRPDLASTARRPGENPPPPRHLTIEAKGWWAKIVEEYGLDDDAGLLLLTVALEAFDRMRGAQRIIKREGASGRDRFGQPKAHPMLVVERDSRAGMITALGKLNLDLEPLADRPSGGRR